MANALACPKCGNSIDSDRLKLEFDGNCPWCLAAFALGDPPEDAPAPHALVSGAKASDRLGKYHLTEKLGTGGMGEVWKALDTELNRWVALKFLKDQDPKELARFTREAHMAAKLSHPGIAAVHEIGQVGGKHFIAMQCIEGRTLESFPRKDLRLLVRLCMDTAVALDHAHRHGVIHRDVKPANLMVEESGEGARVVVLDFGLARPIEGGEKLSVSGSVVGTPQYLSPEQARAERLDERTDVYSLGVTMYEIFTGKTPFEAKNVYEILKKIENDDPKSPRQVTPRVSPDLEKIILKCLEKNRERRYAGAKELADDLRRFMNHEPVQARPPSTIYRLRMKLAKRKSVVAAAVAVLVLAIGVPVVLVKLGAAAEARERLASYQKAYNEGRNAWDEVLQMIGRALPERVLDKVRLAHGHFDRAIEIQEHADAQVMRGRCLQMERKRVEAQAAWERALVQDPENQEARFHLAKRMLLNYYHQRPITYVTTPGKSGAPELWVRMGPETKPLAELRQRAEKMLAGVDGEEKSVYLRGLLCLGKGEFKEGARLLALYNQEGWDTSSISLEGQSRMFWGDIEGAIKCFTRSIELDPREPIDYVNLGCVKSDLGRFDEAIENFSKAIERDPKSAVAWSNRGTAKLRKKEYDGAILDCLEAIKLDSNYATPHFNLGCAYSEKGDLEGAIAEFDATIAIDGNSTEAYGNRGLARIKQERWKEALEDLTTAIKLGPPSAQGYFNRAYLYFTMGHFKEAIADYSEVLKLDNKMVSAWVNRGLAKEKLDRHEEAIPDFEKAIELDSNSADAHFSLGHAREHQDRRDEAIAEYRKAIAIDGKHVNSHVHLGSVLLNMKKYDEALAELELTIQLDNKNALAYANRGALWGLQGSPQKAIEDLTKAIDLDPLNAAKPLANRSLTYEGLGRYEEAIADATRATVLDRKYAHGHNTLGMAIQSQGHHEQAIPHFKRAIDLDQKDATAWNNLGFSLTALGRHDEAVAACLKAIELEPTLAMPYNNLGLARYRLRRFEEAIKDLTVATERDPKLWRAYSNRGLAKFSLGLHDEAIRDYDLVIKNDPNPVYGYFHRGQARAAKGLLDDAIADWEMALKVAPPGWRYRALAQELIDTRGLMLIIDEAARLYEAKNFREAIEKYKGIVDSQPKSEHALRSAYNVGRGYALLGEKKNALDWLEKAVVMGWENLEQLEKDPDLESLRGEDRYKKLAEKLKAK